MFYYHMTWFIILSIILCAIILNKLIINTTKKTKPFIYLFSLSILIYIITIVFILKTRFKTSYIIGSYENIYILLLIGLSGLNMAYSIKFIKEYKINENYLTIILSVLSLFLFITWIMLLLPIKTDIYKDTFYEEFHKILNTYSNLNKK